MPSGLSSSWFTLKIHPHSTITCAFSQHKPPVSLSKYTSLALTVFLKIINVLTAKRGRWCLIHGPNKSRFQWQNHVCPSSLYSPLANLPQNLVGLPPQVIVSSAEILLSFPGMECVLQTLNYVLELIFFLLTPFWL